MKILLGNHHLEVRAGSELFTAELARAFRKRGNDAAIFTFFKGEFAAEMEAEGIQVFDSDDTNRIAGFSPDIIQTCHIPSAHFLRSVIPDAVRAHAMLGVIPPLEAPPLDAGAFSLGLVVSEEVLARVNQTSFGRDVEVAIFRNWFDESSVQAPPGITRRRGRRRRRIAVVSNHFAPELVEALAKLEETGDVTVDYFGLQKKSVVVNDRLLIQYDLVISIGRTVLLAAACGIPCIMADIHGSDGLLTMDNIDRVRTTNFSGRFAKQAITSAHLLKEIKESERYDRDQLREKVAAEYALSSRVDWLLPRYEALLAGLRSRKKPVAKLPAFLPPSEGIVHAEITAEVRRLRARLASGGHEEELRRLGKEVKDRDKQIQAADKALRMVMTKVEDRDRRLVAEVEARGKAMAAADRDRRALTDQIHQADERLRAADGELRQLTSQVADREQRLVAVDRDLRRLTVEIEDRDRRLTAAADELAKATLAAEQDRQALTSQLHDAERRLRAADVGLRVFTMQIGDRNERLATANRDMLRLAKEIESREQKLAAADIGLRRLTDEVADREQKLVVAHGDVHQLMEDVRNREQKLIAADGHLRRLTEEVRDREKKLVGADGDLRRLMDELGDREEKLVAADRALHLLTAGVRSRDEKLVAAEGDFRRLTGEIKDWQQKLVAADSGLRRLEAEIEVRDFRLEQSVAEAHLVRGQLDERERQLKETEQRLYDIETSTSWRITAPARKLVAKWKHGR